MIHPGNAGSAYWLFSLEVDDHPLRMERVTFAGEPPGEVRIAFPITKIRALYRAITTGGETSVGQCVGQDVFDWFLQLSATREISTAVRRIAPCSIFRPVPC